jgi:hypothetical protein
MNLHTPDSFADTANHVMARGNGLRADDARGSKGSITRQTVLQKNLGSAEMPALLAGDHPESR